MAVDRKMTSPSDDKRSPTSSQVEEDAASSSVAPPPAYAESAATSASTTHSSVPGAPSVSGAGSHNVDLEAQRHAQRPISSTPLIAPQQSLQQGHHVLILRPEYPGASRRATKRFFLTLLWALVVYLAACLVTGLFLALVIGENGQGGGGRHGRHGPGKDWDWDGDWFRTLGALSFVVRR